MRKIPVITNSREIPVSCHFGRRDRYARTQITLLWVIDPLDGTTNYSQGLPIFCVSIGLQYQGKTIVGVVYAPYLNELYTAIAGAGAQCNGMPVHVSEKNGWNRLYYVPDFPSIRTVIPITISTTCLAYYHA